MTQQSADLYFREGSSDKVYHVQLKAHGEEDLYSVYFQYGRRGSSLNSGVKNSSPLDFDSAVKVFNSLVKSKTSKGYLVSNSTSSAPKQTTTVVATTTVDKVASGISLQLLNDMTESEVNRCIDSTAWMMQEKYDGRRLAVSRINSRDETLAINKKGILIDTYQSVVDLIKSVGQDIIVDGEIVGERYYIFDILFYDGKDLRSESVLNRWKVLSQIQALSANIVPTYFTAKEKREAFERINEAGNEGVVFKQISSTYVAGRPASGGMQLKYKFWKTDTFIVTSHHKTKRSVGVSTVNSDGSLRARGNVTIPPNYDVPALNEYVEVVYLYCYREGSLYQTKYKGVRDDQDHSDCADYKLKFKPDDYVDED